MYSTRPHTRPHLLKALARYAALLLLASVSLLFSACAAQPLLSDVQCEPTTLRPSGAGETLAISYRIGRDADVTIYLLDDTGERYELRVTEPRAADPDPYTLHFDGTAPTSDPIVQQRLLPSGAYTLVVEAVGSGGASAAERLPITIEGDDIPMPDIENLVVFPETISPNADAVDDIAQITYRLPISATVDINITTPGGQSIPVVTRDEEGPAEWQHIWNGKRPDGSLLSDGVYTYTVQAEDRYGNVVRRQGQIALENVGQPEARIAYASIAPERIMLGETLTVTMRVENVGDVPIRTYGPPSGYTYTTDDVFSSVEDGRYTAQAGGFWRIGMDWDANSGGGPKRYPFRWALSDKPPEEWTLPGEEDWLMPGEEVEIVGRVRVLQRETKMGFYVGLIQDGVGFFQDRSARTIIEVGF